MGKTELQKSLKFDQFDYSDRAIRVKKDQCVHLGQTLLANAIGTMVFRKYDVTLTISFEFLLRVATPFTTDICAMFFSNLAKYFYGKT